MSAAHPAAIITGGTGGMGSATARLMGHDHRIVLADLDRTRLDDAVGELATAGVEAIGVVCDITDKASGEHLFQRAESEGSHVRAVIHAAGISPHMGTAERIARINATGTVNIAQAAEGDALVNGSTVAPRPEESSPELRHCRVWPHRERVAARRVPRDLDGGGRCARTPPRPRTAGFPLVRVELPGESRPFRTAESSTVAA